MADKLTDHLDNRHEMNDCGEQTRKIKRLKEDGWRRRQVVNEAETIPEL